MNGNSLRHHPVVEKIRAEAKRTRFPPVPLLTLTAILGICCSVGTILASRFNDAQSYSYAAALVFVFSIFAIMTVLFQLRLWGRGRLCNLLGFALVDEGDVAIYSWALVYWNVDLATLSAIRPYVHKLLERSLAEMPDVPELHYPLLVDLVFRWRKSQSTGPCQVMLEYLARFGNESELNKLKPHVPRVGPPGASSNLSVKLQNERDTALRMWESRIAGH